MLVSGSERARAFGVAGADEEMRRQASIPHQERFARLQPPEQMDHRAA